MQFRVLTGGLTAEPAWDAERRRRRPQEHGSASQRQPLGVVPRNPELAVPCQPVRSSAASGVPVSGVSVQCPRVRCPATGVQCPMWASRRPGVRCPVWASGVRCPVSSWASGHLGIRRPLSGRSASVVSEPGEFVKRADAASSHTARTAGAGVVARTVSTTGWSSARIGAWRSKLAQAVLGEPRHRLGPGRRRGRWFGSGQVDRVADQDRLDARGGSPVGRGNVCSEVRLLLCQAYAARHTPGHCCSEPRKRSCAGSL
jgi:hypothetical protein